MQFISFLDEGLVTWMHCTVYSEANSLVLTKLKASIFSQEWRLTRKFCPHDRKAKHSPAGWIPKQQLFLTLISRHLIKLSEIHRNWCPLPVFASFITPLAFALLSYPSASLRGLFLNRLSAALQARTAKKQWSSLHLYLLSSTGTRSHLALNDWISSIYYPVFLLSCQISPPLSFKICTHLSQKKTFKHISIPVSDSYPPNWSMRIEKSVSGLQRLSAQCFGFRYKL